MQSRGWRVGEVARMAGLSVRTLHYYDEIGLLRPVEHTDSGHRLYDETHLCRLKQIKALRGLGFSLAEIRECLDRPGRALPRLIEAQIARLRDQIALQQELCASLEQAAGRLRAGGQVEVQEFLQWMEVMKMAEQFFTPEQMEQLRQRREQLGDEHIREVEAEWPELIAKVRAARERGDDPGSEPVRALARRWRELVEEFTGGDSGIAQSLANRYAQDPSLQEWFPDHRELMEYLAKGEGVRG